MQGSTQYIYSSVPDNPHTEMEERDRVLHFFKSNPGVFFRAKEVATELGLPLKATQVKFRKLVTELIEIRGAPIVANSNGFAFATNTAMMRKYVTELETRLGGLQRRVEAVREIEKRMRNGTLAGWKPSNMKGSEFCGKCGRALTGDALEQDDLCKFCAYVVSKPKEE